MTVLLGMACDLFVAYCGCCNKFH